MSYREEWSLLVLGSPRWLSYSRLRPSLGTELDLRSEQHASLFRSLYSLKADMTTCVRVWIHIMIIVQNIRLPRSSSGFILSTLHRVSEYVLEEFVFGGVCLCVSLLLLGTLTSTLSRERALQRLSESLVSCINLTCQYDIVLLLGESCGSNGTPVRASPPQLWAGSLSDTPAKGHGNHDRITPNRMSISRNREHHRGDGFLVHRRNQERAWEWSPLSSHKGLPWTTSRRNPYLWGWAGCQNHSDTAVTNRLLQT